jgi:predicted lipoprotein
MDIGKTLMLLSECNVVIGMSNEGTMKLIKNNSNNEIRCLGDGLNILFDLFNQETQFDYFNEAFKVDFEKLILKHMKRMDFNGCQIISTEEGLWASTG